MKNKSSSRTKVLVFIIFLLTVFLVSISSIYYLFIHKQNSTVKNTTANTEKLNNKNTTQVSTPAKPTSSEILLNFAGDCTIGTDDKFGYQNSLPAIVKKNNNDFSYLFKNVKSIFSKDDLTIVNLETTFTNATTKQAKTFNFKADPKYAKSLTLGSIEGVNISNNHIYDYMQKGFNDTKETLKNNNINFFGEGTKWITEVKGCKLGFLGYTGFSADSTFLNKLKKDISELKSQNCIVIINFHWGTESVYNPNSIQKTIAHFAIDNGADLIIGHHPHVIQGIEQYKEKIICYSMGNFCFGGNFNPSDKDTFILQCKLKLTDKKLTSYDIKVIPCSVSSVNYINDYCPTILSGTKKSDFFNKLNKLSPNLGFKITDDFININVNN